MTDIALVLWQIVLWGLPGISLILITAVWLFIVYAVIRLVAEFTKAYKDTKNLDLDSDPEEESW